MAMRVFLDLLGESLQKFYSPVKSFVVRFCGEESFVVVVGFALVLLVVAVVYVES